MGKYWIYFSLFLLWSCTYDEQNNSSLLSLVPEDTSIIIKINSLDGVRSAFGNNALLHQLDSNNLPSIGSNSGFLKYLNPKTKLILTFGNYHNDSLGMAVITKNHSTLLQLDSLPNYTVETIITKGLNITKSTIAEQVFYSAVKDSILFASTNYDLVASAFATKNSRLPKNLFESSSADASLSIYIKESKSRFHPIIFRNDSLQKGKLADYYLLDGELHQDQLKFDGVAKAADSTKSLITIFEKTFPQQNKIAQICPKDVEGFLSYTFHDFKVFNNNLGKIRNQEIEEADSAMETLLEIGTFQRKNEEAIFLNSMDADNLLDFFGNQKIIETYRDVPIFSFDDPSYFSDLLSPLITNENADKYINIDEFFVFSNSVEFLKDIIANYHNNSTLASTNNFENLMEELSDESSLFVYGTGEVLSEILNSNFVVKSPLQTKEFNTGAIQFVYENNFAHVHLRIQKDKKQATSNSVQEDITVTLDAELLTQPQFVNNHTNSNMDIVVQDVTNNLYLISKDGKVLWKKQLDSRILGKVEQIDTYKNGRLQMAFVTEHRLYVLDRNGNDVGSFPMKFNDKITQPLSVFDYEKKRDYRLLVTQGPYLHMYTRNGHTVKGFTYKKADSDINTQPQHFRIGSKDYIVFVQGNELEILNRVGKTRVQVKNNITFSDSGVFIYENKFTSTSASGDLVQIDENGKMSSVKLNLGEKHAITATNNTLVSLSENILQIKSHKIELEYGNYTHPKLFYVNDKIYVSLTDKQSNKIYLFDSQGKSIPNFPVYGTSSIDLANIDKEKRPELVTQGDKNTLILYQIN